ncbi:hypothetical protein CEXT_483151 [Caerostris extrusa]|uniref:Uncharacterized protein n=1 Tax=Caerostris extrusa TaxID=172846 RepID=A0AAV4R0P7_CAEEX|nr:hypothetical protein CEXT_483151 [Caerostris extrusa]
MSIQVLDTSLKTTQNFIQRQMSHLMNFAKASNKFVLSTESRRSLKSSCSFYFFCCQIEEPVPGQKEKQIKDRLKFRPGTCFLKFRSRHVTNSFSSKSEAQGNFGHHSLHPIPSYPENSSFPFAFGGGKS